MPVVTSWSELTKVTNMLSRTIDPFPVFLIIMQVRYIIKNVTEADGRES